MIYKKHIIKYSFEFIVIVIGISFSFWIDEWSKNNTNRIQHIEDLKAVLNDLKNDFPKLYELKKNICRGKTCYKTLLFFLNNNHYQL